MNELPGATLIIRAGVPEPGHIRLPNQRHVLGRWPHDDIGLDNPFVSSQHAEIMFTSDGYMIRDLGSRNGTIVNGTLLDDKPRQIAILVCGAHFDAAYEIYAHIAVAEHEQMSPQRLSELCANIKPHDLSPQESVAYDVAFALVNGGVLPEPCYRLAVHTFGQHGTNELIYLVGLYALVSMTLNGFNVPVPERD